MWRKSLFFSSQCFMNLPICSTLCRVILKAVCVQAITSCQYYQISISKRHSDYYYLNQSIGFLFLLLNNQEVTGKISNEIYNKRHYKICKRKSTPYVTVCIRWFPPNTDHISTITCPIYSPYFTDTFFCLYVVRCNEHNR